jgi:hypothetical protein
MKNMRDEIISMTSDQKEKEAKSQALLNQVAALPDTLTRYVRAHVHTHALAHAHAHIIDPLLTRRLSNSFS